MSDSENSTVTYTQISSPFADLSDIGSPGVDGPPIVPDDPYTYVVAAFQAPPSPDYVPGPEEPQAPLPLYFILEPVYSEFMPSDDEVLPAEEQPLPAAASPTDQSPGYILESDPEEDPGRTMRIPRRIQLTTLLIGMMMRRRSRRSPPEMMLMMRTRMRIRRRRRSTQLRPTLSHLYIGPRYKFGESSSATTARLTGGRRADYGFVGTMDTEIKRQRAEEVGYVIRDVWVDLREAVEEVAPMTLEGVNTRVTELAAVQEQDTQDIYAVIEDTQDRQTQIYQRVETLVDDSQYHYETARLLDQEALVSREAWGRSIEVSYMARSEIMALRSIVMSQQAVISQLQAADRRSQTVTSEMLQADHMRQAEIAALQTFDRTRQEQLVQTLTLMQSLQG
ncbi:hypothetical protein Tco_1533670 [Tanacetum coccineum]